MANQRPSSRNLTSTLNGIAGKLGAPRRRTRSAAQAAAVVSAHPAPSAPRVGARPSTPSCWVSAPQSGGLHYSRGGTSGSRILIPCAGARCLPSGLRWDPSVGRLTPLWASRTAAQSCPFSAGTRGVLPGLGGRELRHWANNLGVGGYACALNKQKTNP